VRTEHAIVRSLWPKFSKILSDFILYFSFQIWWVEKELKLGMKSWILNSVRMSILCKEEPNVRGLARF